jgi:hypothetical protein
MKKMSKTIESFKEKNHLSELIDEFDEIRKSVQGSDDIKGYINEGKKY